MAGYGDEFDNLKKHDEYVQYLVRKIFRQVSGLLRKRILDDTTFAKAKEDLRKEYIKALDSTNFIDEIEKSTVKVIVNSSYVKSTVEMSKKDYTDRLLKQKLINGDHLNMSRRIRKNTRNIIAKQQSILFEGLKVGKTTATLTRDIKNAQIFEKELPKYINNLTRIRVDGKRVYSTAQINQVKKQISKIKNKGLKRDYNRIVDNLIKQKPIEKSVENAMESKTRQLSYRVTQNQTHATISRFKADTALKDKNTKLVKNEVYGEYTCAYCLGISDLGYIPVEMATLPPHHPHCDCQPKFKKTVRKIEPITQKEYINKATDAVEKRNAANKKKGQPLTYLPIEKPYDLRKNSLTEQLKNTKI